jgi:prepilin-type N-terminal cleavage/methylation domain-containing protein
MMPFPGLWDMIRLSSRVDVYFAGIFLRERCIMQTSRAFTLIELLIVVAIIAILAAIAVPNFLEAQTRAKISRVRADLRTVDVALQAYIVDNNNEPKVDYPLDPSPSYSSWWGFVSHLLTTPVAYITSQPAHPFSDQTVLGAWIAMDPDSNSQHNQVYTVIRHSWVPTGWPPEQAITNLPSYFGTVKVDRLFVEACKQSGYILYSCGPDNMDSAVYGAPCTYDPTNGTVSMGDIYRYGAGSPFDNDDLH